jgi:hypothetical protein
MTGLGLLVEEALLSGLGHLVESAQSLLEAAQEARLPLLQPATRLFAA